MKTGLFDKNGDEIIVGQSISDEGDRPMVVMFGEFVAGRDDYCIEFVCVGFHVKFHDGGTYAITQTGKGYSISASRCHIVNYQNTAQ